jgi:glycine/D-amino acid oxidase-like deaminating enzyme
VTAFSPISFWMDHVVGALPALEGDLAVDVAVVGAGLTGLSTALALRREGLSVAVLERDVVGAGASGRNCGQVGAEIGKNLPTLKLHLGLDRARQVVAVLRTAIGHLERTITAHKIDCAYVPTGNIFAGIHESQRGFVENAARVADDLGVAVRLLEPHDLRARGIPRAIVCGYQESLGGSLDPGRYVRGLREVALEAGVRVFEETPVLRLDEGSRLRLRTPRGSVACDRCVLATNAYSPRSGWLKRSIIPVSVSVMVTEPLNPTQRARIGWDEAEPLYTAHQVLENLRLTPDGRVLVGTKKVRLGFGNRTPRPDDPETRRVLEGTLRERFPELDDVRVDRAWTGQVGLTMDFLPIFGRTGRHRNIYYGAGYSGHGLSMASYAGTIIADQMMGRDPGPARVLIDRFRLPVPPEPLRWIGGHALFTILGFLDRRLDRKARRHVRRSGRRATAVTDVAHENERSMRTRCERT